MTHILAYITKGNEMKMGHSDDSVRDLNILYKLCPSDSGWYKVNVDGSSDEAPETAMLVQFLGIVGVSFFLATFSTALARVFYPFSPADLRPWRNKTLPTSAL